MTATVSTARLEARISPDLHRLLKRAAELQGRTLSDFVVSAAREAAQQAIAQGTVLSLSLQDQEVFANALLAPPAPNAVLQRAFDRRKTLLGAQ